MNRRIFHILCFALLALGTLNSCLKENAQGDGDFPSRQDNIPVRVSVTQSAATLVCPWPAYTGTRSDIISNDEALSTITVAAYASGSLEDFSTFEGGSTSLNLNVGTSYNLYAIANMPGLTFPQSESDLPVLGWTLSDFSSIVNSGVPMSGRELGFIVPAVQNVSAQIALKRLFAKVNVSIDRTRLGDAGLVVNTATVNQINSNLFPFGSSSASVSSVLVRGDIDTVNDGDSFSVYVPENLQGAIGSITNPDDKVPSNMGSLKDICTYLEIGCQFTKDGSSGNVDYRFYLGSNASSNFDVERNKIYNISFAPTDSGLDVEGWWKLDTSGVTDNREIYFVDAEGRETSSIGGYMIDGSTPDVVFYVYYFDGVSDDAEAYGSAWNFSRASGITDGGVAVVGGKTVRKFTYSGESSTTIMAETSDGRKSNTLSITFYDYRSLSIYGDTSVEIVDGAPGEGTLYVVYYDGANYWNYDENGWHMDASSGINISYVGKTTYQGCPACEYSYSISTPGIYTVSVTTDDGEFGDSIDINATTKETTHEYSIAVSSSDTSLIILDGEPVTGEFDVRCTVDGIAVPREYGSTWDITIPNGVNIIGSSVSGEYRTFSFTIASAGTYRIVATTDGDSDYVDIVVVEHNTGISIDSQDTSLEVLDGAPAEGTFEVSYFDGDEWTADGYGSTWEISVPRGITLGSSYVLGSERVFNFTASAAGEYTIVAQTSDGAHSDQVTITVTEKTTPKNYDIRISSSDTSLEVLDGAPAEGTFEVSYFDGDEWTADGYGSTWDISVPSGIALGSSYALGSERVFNFTASAAGEYTIVAQTSDGAHSDQVTITVTEKTTPDNRSISISGDTDLVSLDGATTMGSFEVLYFDGTGYNPDAYGSEWVIDAGMGGINIIDSYVSGNVRIFSFSTAGAGIHTITASTKDGKHSDSITVRVILDPRNIYVQELSQSTITSSSPNASIEFTVEYYDGEQYRTDGWDVSISGRSTITSVTPYVAGDTKYVIYTAIIYGYGDHIVTATTTASENASYGYAISNYTIFELRSN